jgi:hypothetical protein
VRAPGWLDSCGRFCATIYKVASHHSTNHPALALLAHPSFERRGIGEFDTNPFPSVFKEGWPSASEAGVVSNEPREARSFAP